MKRAIYILVLLSVILVGCRAPKELTTDTKQKEQKNIENNISLVETSTLDQVVSQAVQKFFNEKLNININNKVYDTEKPADPETGKPPLKEETNIILSKETNEMSTDSTIIKTAETARSELVDKSKDKSKFEGSEKTTETTGYTSFQKTLMIIGALVLIGTLAYLFIFKLKK